MAYTGIIPLVGGLKTINGDFPLMHASSIQVGDDPSTRLDDVLEELSGGSIPSGGGSGSGLPSVTSDDNGKILRVVEGEWAMVALSSASGVSF